MRVEETLAIAPLFRPSSPKFTSSTRTIRTSAIPPRPADGKQLARRRYGLDGKLIDFGKEEEVDERDLIREYLDFVDDVVDGLNSRQEMNYIRHILEIGTGADRQLKKFEETKDLAKVVDYMAEETRVGLY